MITREDLMRFLGTKKDVRKAPKKVKPKRRRRK